MSSLGHHPYQGIVVIEKNVHHRIHEQGKVGLGFQRLFCKACIGELVRLGSGSLHGRTASAVENAILDHGVIDQVRHLTAEGINLPHQIALA